MKRLIIIVISTILFDSTAFAETIASRSHTSIQTSIQTSFGNENGNGSAALDTGFRARHMPLILPFVSDRTALAISREKFFNLVSDPRRLDAAMTGHGRGSPIKTPFNRTVLVSRERSGPIWLRRNRSPRPKGDFENRGNPNPIGPKRQNGAIRANASIC